MLRSPSSLPTAHPLLFSFLLTGALFGVSLSFLSPAYQTNDDPGMAMIAAGVGLLTPDPHLVFSNVFLGQVLVGLHGWMPLMPWYGIYLVVALAMAQVALTYAIFSLGWSRRRLLLYLFHFAVVGLHVLVVLQFTTVTFTVAQGGLALLWSACVKARNGAPRPVPLAMGVLLLVLASLIRLEALVLALVLALPVTWALLADTEACRRLLAWAAVALASLVLLGQAYDSAHYRDSRWLAFRDFDRVRVRFTDYDAAEADLSKALPLVGWSENDLKLLRSWFFADPGVFALGKMTRLLGETPPVRWPAHRKRVSRGLRRCARDTMTWVILAAYPCFFVGCVAGRRRLATFVLSPGLALAIFLGLAVSYKTPPQRVYLPLLSFPLVAALCFAEAGRFSNQGMRCRWRNHLALVAAVGACIGGLVVQLQYARGAAERQARLRAFVAATASSSPLLFILWDTSILRQARALEGLAGLGHLRVFRLGWAERTPPNRDLLASFSVSDVVRALYERTDVLLVAREDQVALLSTYAREHHGVKLQFVAVSGVPGAFRGELVR